ncbi:hypothetical protein AYJ08_08135 [Brevibacillus sp. SKDU10]|uniref:AAA family ATPase n=1 Tax=Brevibacillus TaxID=55080 RepID=UPI0007C89F28|nr:MULTISPECIES: AAA family ATPase [Brevibacillus]OAJ74717.1 hypothetical protein AYJ08_08135 [Brevibacillus sp. SKDU10]GIO01625.1 prophage P2a protein 4; AAA ATPase [Brevibacillus halotolerans]
MTSKSRNKINSINILRFRKLINISFMIANRITVIAGHNGIGKSTILGLIANGSELKGHKSYFEKIFQSQFQEIFHLDLKSDYITEKDKKYSVLLNYNYEDKKINKKCTISKHNDARLKIVPRNANEDGNITNENILNVGASGKVPIPTIYIGMSRVIPIGESDRKLYSLTSSSNVHEEDIKYLNDTYRLIIGNESLGEERVSKQKLRHSTKSSIGPDFKDYPYQSVSLGQDSLSSILTSLISFRKLKRELRENYKGGILLIDELDACLHPSAQEKLINVLDQASKSLNLQIICTSHSLTVIKEVMGKKITSSQNPADGNLYYNVVYIQNTISPTIMNQPTYKKIKNDMFLRFSNFQDNKQEIKIYLEDNEAEYFFNTILDNAHEKIDRDDLRLTPISTNINCDTLLKLPLKDSYFKGVIIVPDGDVKSKYSYSSIIDNHDNICALPCKESPERIIHLYLEQLVNEPDHSFWTNNQEILHTQLVRDNLLKNIEDRLNGSNDKKIREHYKNWFNEFKTIFEKTEIVKYWMNDNPDDLEEFIYQFNISLNHLRKFYLVHDI